MNNNISEILSQLRLALIQNSDEQLRERTQYFFKEYVRCYGMKSATMDRIGKEYFKKIKELPKNGIFGLCDELWESGMMEEGFIACNWSYYIYKKYEPSDIKVFEKWINLYVNNWAACDAMGNHTVGAFLELYPEYVSELKRWTASANRWVRRASAVSLIVPARRGLFLNDIFEIADLLLLDSDDMVQKGYGWMLKVASQKHQNEVFEYVMTKKSIMPRTALRYAIEKMPAEMKIRAMGK